MIGERRPTSGSLPVKRARIFPLTERFILPALPKTCWASRINWVPQAGTHRQPSQAPPQKRRAGLQPQAKVAPFAFVVPEDVERSAIGWLDMTAY